MRVDVQRLHRLILSLALDAHRVRQHLRHFALALGWPALLLRVTLSAVLLGERCVGQLLAGKVSYRAGGRSDSECTRFQLTGRAGHSGKVIGRGLRSETI